MTAEQIWNEAKKIEEQMIADRRYLHAHAETGFELTETVAYVTARLKEMGYEPESCGKAGVVVTVGNEDGKVFLIRGDMDALPVKEEADVPFACDKGTMHGCGHDMHTAMLLGAAKILKEHEEEICGTVKLMFQPAEEIFEGSHDMIEAGVLKNPDVAAALMVHVMANTPFESGSVIVCDPGISAPSADCFQIMVQGSGCHGATPNLGVDPITVASHIVLALQEISARELAINDEAVLTFGSIHGGNADNVIPDTVSLTGTLRTYDEEVRQQILLRMKQITEGIAATYRASASVEIVRGCPTLKNDAGLSAFAAEHAKELLGAKKVFTAGQINAMSGAKKPPKSAGSEDFAYVSQEVPSIMLALSAGTIADGYCYPQHHPKAKFDEAALASGASVYAYLAMQWLEEN
jgi:hippurate hydrolase